MTLRQKTLLTYFLASLAPLLLLAILNHWNGVRLVNATLTDNLQLNLSACISEIDRHLLEQEGELRTLATSPEIKQFLTSSPGGKLSAPEATAVHVALASSLKGSMTNLALLDQSTRRLLFVERGTGANVDLIIEKTIPPTTPVATGADVLPAKDIQLTPDGATFRRIIPIVDEGKSTVVGYVVGQVNLRELFSDSAGVLEEDQKRGDRLRSMVLVLDNSKRVLYDTDHSLEGKSVSEAVPGFAAIASEAMANNSGIGSFAGNAGQNYLVTYSPLPWLNLVVAVAGDRGPAIGSAHRWGLLGYLVAALLAVACALFLERTVQRKSSSMERVAQDVSAIAKGELDRRIVLKSSDDARGLADNINVVAERLRAQIAREEESRQFESFVRLSAMLTHDLKNAIEALSLTVGNMERHFDNEQFRVDALKSLTGATDKLKAIVARLSKPLTSLSGELKRPTSTDLVPMLKRVVAMTAEPLREKHAIEIKLPTTLFAVVDVVRIEEVAENLVLNALEAMSEKGGKLRIEAAETPSGAAMFAVSDSGPGMSEAFIKNRLFRPFSTTKKNGVGLGLYTCREVVQAHAGSIEVESVEGAGTTFRVVLPSDPNHRRN